MSEVSYLMLNYSKYSAMSGMYIMLVLVGMGLWMMCHILMLNLARVI